MTVIANKSTNDPMVQAFARAVEAAGGKALLVGGLVRDELLGLESKDYDFEIFGLPMEKVQEIMTQFGNVKEVGQQFGVLNIQELDWDVALPRREKKTGKGHTDFDVVTDPTMTVEEAARRRDFTINAMSKDPLTGEVIDPLGGMADLKAGVLRMADPNTFSDDPLRALRAAQFAARFDFDVEPETLKVVAAQPLEELPGERILPEFSKMLLKGKKPSRGIEVLRQSNLLRYFPEIEALQGVVQDKDHHPEGDVYVHTLMVIDEAARQRTGDPAFDLPLMFGALAHDFGKPNFTQVEESGRVRALGHEEGGLEPTNEFMNRMKAPNALTEQVGLLVAAHLRPQLMPERAGSKGYRKLSRLMEAADVSPELLAAVSKADTLGRTTEKAIRRDTRLADIFLSEYKQHVTDAIQPGQKGLTDTVMGKDLIARGMKPGPDMGKFLTLTRAIEDETGLKDPDEIIELATRFLSDRSDGGGSQKKKNRNDCGDSHIREGEECFDGNYREERKKGNTKSTLAAGLDWTVSRPCGDEEGYPDKCTGPGKLRRVHPGRYEDGTFGIRQTQRNDWQTFRLENEGDHDGGWMQSYWSLKDARGGLKATWEDMKSQQDTPSQSSQGPDAFRTHPDPDETDRVLWHDFDWPDKSGETSHHPGLATTAEPQRQHKRSLNYQPRWFDSGTRFSERALEGPGSRDGFSGSLPFTPPEHEHTGPPPIPQDETNWESVNPEPGIPGRLPTEGRECGDQEKYPEKCGPSGFETVNEPLESFTNLDEPDEYLYHVTTVDTAQEILDSGLVPGAGSQSMDEGYYRQYSGGKSFLSERDGVSFWGDTVENHLFSQYDDPPEVTVLKFPKSQVGIELHKDEEGSRDSRRDSYYITEPLSATGAGQEAYFPTQKPFADKGAGFPNWDMPPLYDPKDSQPHPSPMRADGEDGESPLSSLPGKFQHFPGGGGLDRAPMVRPNGKPSGTGFQPIQNFPQKRNMFKADLLPGGKGDDMPDDDFNRDQLERGTEDEMDEHGVNDEVAKEITKDHLVEDEDFYAEGSPGYGRGGQDPNPEIQMIRNRSGKGGHNGDDKSREDFDYDDTGKKPGFLSMDLPKRQQITKSARTREDLEDIGVIFPKDYNLPINDDGPTIGPSTMHRNERKGKGNNPFPGADGPPHERYLTKSDEDIHQKPTQTLIPNQKLAIAIDPKGQPGERIVILQPMFEEVSPAIMALRSQAFEKHGAVVVDGPPLWLLTLEPKLEALDKSASLENASQLYNKVLKLTQSAGLTVDYTQEPRA